MRKTRRLRRLGIACVALAALGGLAVIGFVKGWHVHRLTPAELAALLQPGMQIVRPDGPGPFPAVIQFHGCGGRHAAEATWAAFLRDRGYVAVSVDSLGPRHISAVEAPKVCQGRTLWGRERAGDVLVALDAVRKLPYVDPQRIVLMGWSHGGWSIMDLLALDPPRQLPTNLTAAPDGGLAGVAGVILVYPYLGFASIGPPIAQKVPILMLLSGADTVVPTPAALAVATRLRSDGFSVDTHVYAGKDHCWDQTDLPPTSTLVYDAAVTADAHDRVAAWLARTVR
ncbi:MAG TPA: prolyl oligopeptidase family serine peptidase [Kofleriaceae bacterium]|nr:prolyl oligopeptidase family serine peptidase [Kofleriaceae bacterium]